jgi:hypothetical protein
MARQSNCALGRPESHIERCFVQRFRVLGAATPGTVS